MCLGEGGRRTWWETELGVLEVEVYDFGEGVHLRRLEVSYELCQTLLELGVCIDVSVSHRTAEGQHLHTTGSKQFWPSIVRLA